MNSERKYWHYSRLIIKKKIKPATELEKELKEKEIELAKLKADDLVKQREIEYEKLKHEQRLVSDRQA